MAVTTLINGSAEETISPLDRGLAYGDGLFESIRFIGASAPLWQRHMQRLDESCRRLHLLVPDAAQLWEEAISVSRDLPHAVVRIMLTRGVGERGYALPVSPSVTRIVAAFVAPVLPAKNYAQGVHVRVCELRLAAQPALAGIKHLNRLEQVLASRDWPDGAVEGILCDERGAPVCGTRSNLFWVQGGRLHTPALDGCGVAGMMRDKVLACATALGLEVRIESRPWSKLLDAEEAFVSNSLIGIWPLRSLEQRVWQAPGPFTSRLISVLRHPYMAS